MIGVMNATDNRPNLLFVFSDQHRWCDLGCYGNPEVFSPHLDRFSSEAIRFENCISNSPVCVPARGSLLSGLYPLRHRAITNDLPIRTDLASIAFPLNQAGYQTGYIGKWHLGGVPRDRYIPKEERLGFQEWKVCNCSHAYQNAYFFDEENRRVEVEGYEPVAQTSLAVDFIHRQSGHPWGLVLSWGPPHDPYFEIPQPYLDRYSNHFLHLRENVQDFAILNQQISLTRDQIRDNYRGYYAHITALDEQFGRLLLALEETGQDKNTLVVYTSDHGDMLGSQGLTNKQLPYEESIHVPLLARLPGVTRMGVTDELISLVDLPVSLLSILGFELPGLPDGRDLSCLFTQVGVKGLDACYIVEYTACHQAVARGEREWRGLRTPRYTFARSAIDDGFLLTDHITDPYQLHNLVHQPQFQALRTELSKMLDAYILRHDALLPWDELICAFGLKDEWNRSQAYFGMPTLP
jgi:arylsulfatase A-like enzyme